MTDNAEASATPAALPEASVGRSRRFSLIWLIPLVALGIAGYLAYVTLSQAGPTISITFKSAEGLEPGKTRIKLKEVAVGTVRTVSLAHD
jgi:paraquat-inducible protein B